jgi:hypothetical protein
MNSNRNIIRMVFALLGATAVVAVFFGLSARSAPPVGYPPVKQTIEAGLEQTRVAARKSPQPLVRRVQVAAGATSTPDAPRTPAGSGWIVQDFASPFPAMSHVITSMWYDEIGATRVIVFAGALRDNPGISLDASQSVVIVQVESLDGSILPGSGTWQASQRAGPLRIIDARSERLVLRAENGSTMYFDVPLRQFVSSLN